MLGQITDLEIVREVERRGIYTSALVEPPVEPIIEIREEVPEFPEEPVIVYPRGPEEEEIPLIPIVSPPVITVPVIEIRDKEPFTLTKTHIIAGAALLAVIYLSGRAPSIGKGAARRPPAKPANKGTNRAGM